MTLCDNCGGTGITGFTLLENKAVRCEVCSGGKVPIAFRKKAKPLGGAVIPVKNE